MGKKIILRILFLLMLSDFVAAQQVDQTISLNNLVLLQATISPGYMFYKGGLWNSYFHSTLEWCFDNRVSIRSDGSYFFTTQGDYKPFKMNHSLLLGAFYHFPENKSDFYFGLQPGAACVQQTSYTYNDSTISNPALKVAPIITATIGANYFFWKYMNMFVALKYVHGTFISDYGNSIPLDEFRISAGLGFQLRCTKNRTNVQ
jgi:hypothetical protein